MREGGKVCSDRTEKIPSTCFRLEGVTDAASADDVLF